MELTNDFRVAVPVARTWEVLNDVERIAPCMPGAQLQEIEGDEHRGIVKVKVGPITAQYKGQATFVERDEGAGRLVLRAEGRETRGQGNASATITATLTPDGEGTAVSVVTDLTITGKVAQFGRGVLADVSSKLLDQFVDCLEATVLVDEEGAAADAPTMPAPDKEAVATPPAPREAAGAPEMSTEAAPAASASRPAPASTAGTTSTVGGSNGAGARAGGESAPGVRTISSPEPEAVDLLGTAGSPVVKRLAPVAAVLAVLWWLRRRRRRRRAR